MMIYSWCHIVLVSMSFCCLQCIHMQCRCCLVCRPDWCCLRAWHPIQLWYNEYYAIHNLACENKMFRHNHLTGHISVVQWHSVSLFYCNKVWKITWQYHNDTKVMVCVHACVCLCLSVSQSDWHTIASNTCSEIVLDTTTSSTT